MSSTTRPLPSVFEEQGEVNAFDLDIREFEFGDPAVPLINLTDDGCGSTCPKACATNFA
jgi:FxLD family lantipeptide